MKLFYYWTLMLCCWTQGLYATAYTWKGGDGPNPNDWGTAANWTPAGVPTATDEVSIPATVDAVKLNSSRSVNACTLNGGTLDLNGFTLTITGPAVLTTGTVLTCPSCTTGLLSCSGASTVLGNSSNVNVVGPVFGTATRGVDVTVSSATVSVNHATFYGTTRITKTGTTNDNSLGGNVFNGPTFLTNAGSGYLLFAPQYVAVLKDVFNGELTLSNTGTSYLCLGYRSTGNQLNGNVIVSCSNGLGVYLSYSYGAAGSCVLAAGKTISVNGFTTGTLGLQGFTQEVGPGLASRLEFALGGTASLQLGPSSVFKGEVDLKAPQLFLNGGVFQGPTVLEKTGATNNNGIGGDVYFNGPTTITNSGSGALAVGGNSNVITNADLQVNNLSTGTITLANNNTGNRFNGHLTLNSAGSGGIYFSNGTGSSQLASGKRLSVVPNGNGPILIKKLTQLDDTPQDLSDNAPIDLQLNSSATLYVQSCAWTGPFQAKAGGITLLSNRFAQSAQIVKTGSSNEAHSGNVYQGVTSIENQGTGSLQFNYETYQADLTLSNTGAGKLVPGMSGTSYYNGNLSFNSTSGGGILFDGSPCRLAEGKQLKIGSLGFTAGDLRINALTQLGTTPQALVLTASARLAIGSIFSNRSTFNGPVDFKAPALYLNGAVFNNSARLERTGSWDVNTFSQGGNLFNGTTSIINSSTQQWLTSAYPANPKDIYNGEVTFSSAGLIRFGGGLNVFFNDNVILNGVNAGSYLFNGGPTQLAEGKTLSSSSFGSGSLTLSNFKQLGTTPQNLSLGSASQLRMSNCTFGGAVNFTAGSINLTNNRFEGEVTLYRIGNVPDGTCTNNVFRRRLFVRNQSTYPFYLGNGNDETIR